MFSQKNKLEKNLNYLIENKSYKNYRVLIHCKTMRENIENKIKTYKCEIIRSIASLNCICANVPPNVIERLIEYPQVDYICLDNYAFLCGNSVLSANGIFFQERYKLTGKGVCVAIIDSGVYPHPDLITPSNRIKKFIDIINNCTYPYDDNGHGTFVSGLIAGNGISSNYTYKGMAENSSLYAIKAFNSVGRGFVSDILYSIENIIDYSSEFNIKVLCLPFELTYNDHFILSLFSSLFEKAVNLGLVVVVPSGHNGSSEGSIRGIATLQNCITVGGLNTNGSIKPYAFSSCGPFGKGEKPDLSAACVDIVSLNSNINYISEKNGRKIYPQPLENPYTNYTGTSCACAYIAGLCCLLFENKPTLCHKDMLSLLKVSCKLLDFSKWVQGAGIVELNKLMP